MSDDYGHKCDLPRLMVSGENAIPIFFWRHLITLIYRTPDVTPLAKCHLHGFKGSTRSQAFNKEQTSKALHPTLKFLSQHFVANLISILIKESRLYMSYCIGTVNQCKSLELKTVNAVVLEENKIGRTQCRELPLCAGSGRVSVANLTLACAMRGDHDSNPGPSGHRR